MNDADAPRLLVEAGARSCMWGRYVYLAVAKGMVWVAA